MFKLLVKELEGTFFLFKLLNALFKKKKSFLFLKNSILKRKTQRKLQELENQIEIANQNEAMAYKSLEKLTKRFNKLKAEKEFFETKVLNNIHFQNNI